MVYGHQDFFIAVMSLLKMLLLPNVRQVVL